MTRKPKSGPKPSPWDILGLSPDATRQEIDKAWKACAFANHPDRNLDDEEAAERFKAGSAAYEELTGKALEVDPDEEMAVTAISAATEKVIKKLLVEAVHPKTQDLAAAIKQSLVAELGEQRKLVAGTRQAVAWIEASLGRFTGAMAETLEDVIGQHVLSQGKRELQQWERNVRAIEKALQMLADTGFRRERPQASPIITVNGTSKYGGWK